MWVKFHRQFEDWLYGDENVVGTTTASANGLGAVDLGESAIKTDASASCDGSSSLAPEA